ncbi:MULTISPECIES: aminopeptidase P family protein [unclassified Breznakia]|uniref:aminopeptidase P family protein n=1 Tax=unclassified Breznakia TaxID=2623764 RepID=UPI002406B59D|nr:MULTISPECIES: aminopeptidase P family protein [unclassified Breznakia]MDF9838218.1 Xaa-Pro aminopeptidase [Breznakia sp. PFB2-8]MDF9860233.1 Xaa-Pro aminopeptidase [Breznakia sp. PH5-24]MDL2276148.1 aminopeptidase P family protein [Breznakia sp. OttesenSCG-928-G09]
MINERINELRKLMKLNEVDLYYIPTSDYHNSEYVGSHFQAREYMSGFTGSAGVMIVTLNQACLWSDGRYYIQAEEQIKGTEIIFKRQGEVGVETPFEFVRSQIHEGFTIAFDGKTVSAQLGKQFESLVKNNHGKVLHDVDFVGDIWKERPNLEIKKAFILDKKYVGETTKAKISKLREKLHTYRVANHLITSLDDIAYLLNIRGRDIPSTPVILSYLLVTDDAVKFYVNKDKLSLEVLEYLSINNIEVKPYADAYEDINKIQGSILIDPEIVNFSLYKGISSSVQIIEQENPTIMMKAIKNAVEIENLRIAHIKDGVAITKFMYWLKKNIGTMEMDEVSVADKLTELRAEQLHYIEPSFDTISAYNANAAMMHYHATDDHKSNLKAEGLLLVDSGGQYLNGTTDITRTFALGKVDAVWKRDFTLVLRGMSTLSRAKFLTGCSGINLDILARQPLWNIGIDYRCGTGHGVGFVLGVHEGPHGIRWRKSYRKEDTPLYPGMVVTNEPGVYQEGSHGIRIENELIVKKDESNEYGQFLSFETITFAPIDLDMIDVSFLDDESKSWLNDYHKQVFEKVSPYLTTEETTWLKEYTKAI